MEIKNSLFDVAVLGGGPAGAATSIHLRRLGRKVILFEGSSYNVPRIGETLAPSIRPMLSELVKWDSFLATDPISSYGIKSAWGGNDLMSTSFISSPFGSGWHIDRQIFDRMLCNFAAAEGVVVLYSSNVTDIVPKENVEEGWILKIRHSNNEKIKDKRKRVLSTEASFQARSIINATGRSPVLIQKLRAKQIIYDSLVGLAARFQVIGEPVASFTLIEATEDGWWYSAPLPHGGCIVVLMTDADIMARNHLNYSEVWMDYFNKTEHTKTRLFRCRLLEGLKIFSASSRRLTRHTYDYKWLAVGDAALAVDPLSANGIFFALRSGRQGAHAIDHWLSGNPSDVLIYEQELDKERDQYLKNRYYYYELERRWPNAPFWQRRSAPKSIGPEYQD